MTLEDRVTEFPWLGAAQGEPVAEEGRRWQRYESGAALIESGHGTFIVYGAIADRYFRLGGPGCGLGVPITDELVAEDGVGRYNEFEHGGIFWSPTTGAHELHGEIGATWRSEGGVHSSLGYPITDELDAGGFFYQYFQFGSLRWSAERRTERGCPPNRLFGLADMHSHPASGLGFGGLIHGDVEGSPEQALRSCEPTHGVTGLGTDWAATIALGALGAGVFLTGGVLAPQAALALAAHPRALLLAALEESLGHRTQGWPNFDGWASWWSRTHQQMYLDWVRRAFDHGQRLMVALAVQSELVASVAGRHQSDMDAAWEQLRFLRDLAERNAEWLSIARSPAEARDIIASNRLAIVLGVELDYLGGFEGAEAASADAISQLVERLWAEGVRYVFPIHLTDNVYGGMALYEHAFIVQSALRRSEFPAVEENPAVDFQAALIPNPSGPGHVNQMGLTSAGHELLRALMDKGMLIDIDHMSWHATADALSVAEARQYPVVSGHATFADLVPTDTVDSHSTRNESRKTADIVERLRLLGSVIGVQPVPLATADPADPIVPIAPDCPGSSTTFARALQYARIKMGGRVAIGTDLNGLARTSCPRFGPGAGHAGSTPPDERRAAESAQTAGVRYRTPIQDVRGERLDPPAGVYSGEERDLFRAVLVAESGLPEDRWGYDIFSGPLPAYVRGLRGGSENPNDDELVGYLARTGGDASALPPDKQAKVQLLRTIVKRWDATKGPNPPLERCVTGSHDFDFNLEGLAHYGMLPDLLADTANIGLHWDIELLDLLLSSETLVQTWEKCAGTRPTGYEDVSNTVHQDKHTLAPAPGWTGPVVEIPPDWISSVTPPPFAEQ